MKRSPWHPLRWLGVVLGVILILVALLLLVSPGESLLHVVSFVGLGSFCLFYGFSGRSYPFSREREVTGHAKTQSDT